MAIWDCFMPGETVILHRSLDDRTRDISRAKGELAELEQLVGFHKPRQSSHKLNWDHLAYDVFTGQLNFYIADARSSLEGLPLELRCPHCHRPNMAYCDSNYACESCWTVIVGNKVVSGDSCKSTANANTGQDYRSPFGKVKSNSCRKNFEDDGDQFHAIQVGDPNSASLTVIEMPAEPASINIEVTPDADGVQPLPDEGDSNSASSTAIEMPVATASINRQVTSDSNGAQPPPDGSEDVAQGAPGDGRVAGDRNILYPVPSGLAKIFIAVSSLVGAESLTVHHGNGMSLSEKAKIFLFLAEVCSFVSFLLCGGGYIISEDYITNLICSSTAPARSRSKLAAGLMIVVGAAVSVFSFVFMMGSVLV